MSDLEESEERGRRLAELADRFRFDGAHYKGTCEIFQCIKCCARIHCGRRQMPDHLVAHACDLST